MSEQIPLRPLPIYVPPIYPAPQINLANVPQPNTVANQMIPVLPPPLLGLVPRIVAPHFPLPTVGGFNTGGFLWQQQPWNQMMLLNQHHQRERFILAQQQQQEQQQFQQQCIRKRGNLKLQYQQELGEIQRRYDALSRQMENGIGIGQLPNLPQLQQQLPPLPPPRRRQSTTSPPKDNNMPVVISNRRHNYTAAENAYLVAYYAKCKFPLKRDLTFLSEKLLIDEIKIRDWFVRHRSREREEERELKFWGEEVKRRLGANGQ